MLFNIILHVFTKVRNEVSNNPDTMINVASYDRCAKHKQIAECNNQSENDKWFNT